MIIEGRHQFGSIEGSGSCLIVEDFHAGREEIIAFSHGPFIFSAERTGAVGVIDAVPLVAEDSLNAVIAGKDACQGRVPEERRLVELRKMDILSPDGSSRQEKVKRQYENRQMFLQYIITHKDHSISF